MINPPDFDTYFSLKCSENDMWQFFDPANRKWVFLNIKKDGSQSYFVIFRNGWIVRKVHRKRSPYYFQIKKTI